MGTCCNAHLATKIRDYARNAENGAVTVTVIENPKVDVKVIPSFTSTDVRENTIVYAGACDYCKAPAEFTCSYYPKKI